MTHRRHRCLLHIACAGNVSSKDAIAGTSRSASTEFVASPNEYDEYAWEGHEDLEGASHSYVHVYSHMFMCTVRARARA